MIEQIYKIINMSDNMTTYEEAFEANKKANIASEIKRLQGEDMVSTSVSIVNKKDDVVSELFSEMFDDFGDVYYINNDNVLALERNKTFLEAYDKKKFAFLYNRADEVARALNTTVEKTTLLNYSPKSVHYNQFKVRYSRDETYYGRYFAKSSMSLQAMKSEIRNAISSELYYDFDIKACNQSIICWLANNVDSSVSSKRPERDSRDSVADIDDKVNIACVQNYVKHRDTIIQDLMNHNPDSTYAECKRAFTSITFGSKAIYFDDKRTRKIVRTDGLTQYQKSLTGLSKKLLKKFPEFVQIANKKLEENGNPKNKDSNLVAFSYLIQFIEGQIVLRAMNAISGEYPDMVGTASWQFDGFAVRRTYNRRQVDPQMCIMRISSYLHKMGCDEVRFAVKQMDDNGLLKKLRYDESTQEEKIRYNEVDPEHATEFTPDENVKYNTFDVNDDYYFDDFVHEFCTTRFGSPAEVWQFGFDNLHRVFAMIKMDTCVCKYRDDMFCITPYTTVGTYMSKRLCLSYAKKEHAEDDPLHGSDILTACISRLKNIITFDEIMCDFDYKCSTKRIFYACYPIRAKEMTDEEYDSADKTLLNQWLAFVKHTYCSDNDEVYEYLLTWLEFMLIHPDRKSGKSVCLYGKQGIGKSMLGNLVGNHVFGEGIYRELTGIEELLSKNNIMLYGAKFTCVNELCQVREDFISQFNRLKSVITELKMTIKKLYCDSVSMEQRMELILTTNNERALMVDNSDRRFLILSCNNDYAIEDTDTKEEKDRKATYMYNMYSTFINDSFGRMFFNHIIRRKTVDLERFPSKPPPDTQLKKDLKCISMSDSQSFLQWLTTENVDVINEMIASPKKFSSQMTEDGVITYSRIVDGEYVDIDAIIPSTNKTKTTFRYPRDKLYKYFKYYTGKHGRVSRLSANKFVQDMKHKMVDKRSNHINYLEFPPSVPLSGVPDAFSSMAI